MEIAVLSDTHGLLRPEAAKEDAPIYIVRGNNDKEWADICLIIWSLLWQE